MKGEASGKADGRREALGVVRVKDQQASGAGNASLPAPYYQQVALQSCAPASLSVAAEAHSIINYRQAKVQRPPCPRRKMKGTL